MQIRFTIPTPPDYRFDTTVRGHGWYDLPPFRLESDGGLGMVHDTGDKVLEITTRGCDGKAAVEVSVSGPDNAEDRSKARQVVTAALRLDANLEGFYKLTDADPRLAWARPAGAGRLLRSPTVFEDLVKLVCTTNCNWAATRRMVTAMVETAGAVGRNGLHAFPTPARLAAVPGGERFYRDTVRAGYRAPALHALATSATREPRALERLRGVSWPSADLRRALLGLRGVGPYSAENLLKLLDRYDYLAVDSWCLSKYARLHPVGRDNVTAATLDRAYRRYGAYRGLAMWLDLTRDWPCYAS